MQKYAVFFGEFEISHMCEYSNQVALMYTVSDHIAYFDENRYKVYMDYGRLTCQERKLVTIC